MARSKDQNHGILRHTFWGELVLNSWRGCPQLPRSPHTGFLQVISLCGLYHSNGTKDLYASSLPVARFGTPLSTEQC